VKRATGGFTIVEVLVAVVVLSVGIVAMAGSAATVTRMIGRGQKATRAAQVASQRFEQLRLQAYSAAPKCTGLAGGTATSAYGVTEKWVVTANGTSRTLVDSVTYKAARGGTHTDVLTTIIEC
jgi:type IV pilus assembly protein PilV